MQSGREFLHLRQHAVVAQVDGEGLHLVEHAVQQALLDQRHQVPGEQRGVERLRLGVDDLVHHLREVRLEQFRPGLVQYIDLRLEDLGVFHEGRRVLPPVGIVRRGGDELELVLLGDDVSRVAPAANRVVDALAGGAEAGWCVQLRVGGQRGSFGVGVDAQHPQLAQQFLHRESAGGGLRVQDDLAAFAVHQVAHHLGGFVGLALGIAGDQFQLAAIDAAGGDDLVDLHPRPGGGGLAEKGEDAGEHAGHADLDRPLVLGGDDVGHRQARRRQSGTLDNTTAPDRTRQPLIDVLNGHFPLLADCRRGHQ